ncbi:MAG TPA: YbhB/YbcL family Raf kinase inhibitor-like protein [Candidatus Baltobacteraceae bacterium]|nr:YbhB/YbcL family Raf kinase inhibitor-like protein [Candidatus Baltobacteraceae bacterium]
MIFAALTFTIASATFKPNGTMPMSTVYARCGGQNHSPELHWQGAPEGTRSFALIVHDPDAPRPGGWYHWVFYNMPASLHSLPEGAAASAQAKKHTGWDSGTTSFGETSYGGPCPPPGKPHHYHFTLYAIDVPSLDGAHLTGPQLERAMKGHILAQARVTGLYGRR